MMEWYKTFMATYAFYLIKVVKLPGVPISTTDFLNAMPSVTEEVPPLLTIAAILAMASS